MQPSFLDSILTSVASQGPLCGVLLLAVWWLTRNNKAILDAYNKERDDRITGLETHVNECNDDRKKIRDQMVDLLVAQAKK
jgi:hypothetical protein